MHAEQIKSAYEAMSPAEAQRERLLRNIRAAAAQSGEVRRFEGGRMKKAAFIPLVQIVLNLHGVSAVFQLCFVILHIGIPRQNGCQKIAFHAYHQSRFEVLGIIHLPATGDKGRVKHGVAGVYSIQPRY